MAHLNAIEGMQTTEDKTEVMQTKASLVATFCLCDGAEGQQTLGTSTRPGVFCKDLIWPILEANKHLKYTGTFLCEPEIAFQQLNSDF